MAAAYDLADPVSGTYIEEYLAAAEGVDVLDRIKVRRMIENLVPVPGSLAFRRQVCYKVLKIAQHPNPVGSFCPITGYLAFNRLSFDSRHRSRAIPDQPVPWFGMR